MLELKSNISLPSTGKHETPSKSSSKASLSAGGHKPSKIRKIDTSEINVVIPDNITTMSLFGKLTYYLNK
jgi:hypothetical protein